MRRIQESVEPLAVPADPEVEIGSQRRDDQPEVAQGDALQLATFDSGNLGPGESGKPGQICLAEVLADAQRSNGTADAEGVHARIVAKRTLPALIAEAWDDRTRPPVVPARPLKAWCQGCGIGERAQSSATTPGR